MNTLGNTTKNVVTREESYSINIAFTCAAALPKGALVKLNTTTGKVEEATASDAFGILTVGCKNADETVTVQTQFNTEIKGLADGAVTTGDVVATTGFDEASGLVKYATAVGGNVAVGIALETVATTEEVVVGILRTFHTVAGA